MAMKNIDAGRRLDLPYGARPLGRRQPGGDEEGAHVEIFKQNISFQKRARTRPTQPERSTANTPSVARRAQSWVSHGRKEKAIGAKR
jgi:hypothetical protein